MTGRLPVRGRAGGLALAILLAAAGAGCGSGSTSSTEVLAASNISPAALTADPGPPAASPPVALPVALPVPAAPPDPNSTEPFVEIGVIEIPRLGLRVPLAEGITLGTLDRGPSHWPGTAMPGEVGNVVVAGHRVTNTKPFRHIDDLVPGDEVIFEVAGTRWVYQMTAPEIVPPTGMHIVEQTAARTATLFACHPPGSARYRYVVHLELVT